MMILDSGLLFWVTLYILARASIVNDYFNGTINFGSICRNSFTRHYAFRFI